MNNKNFQMTQIVEVPIITILQQKLKIALFENYQKCLICVLAPKTEKITPAE